MLIARRSLLSLLGLACVLPSAAVAAPYEQVSRETGPAGASINRATGSPLAVGDVGRYAGYQASGSAHVRDIRTNVTSNLGGTSEVSLIAFNRAETFALLIRRSADADRLVAVPLPIGSAAERVLYTAPGRGLGAAATRLSADGTTVVVSDPAARELRSVDVASGAVTTITTSFPTEGWTLGEYSVSANGRTVLAYDVSTNASTLFQRDAGGSVTASSAPISGLLSPDGSAVVRIDSAGNEAWVVRDPVGPAPWTSTRFTPPAPAPAYGSLVMRWLSSNGSVVVIARGAPDADASYPAFALNTSTGSVGPFGGRFRESIAAVPGKFGYGSGEGTLIAPGGRMALLPVGGQIVLADLAGAHLVGANEPLSANVHYKFSYTQRCTTSFLSPPRFFGTQTLTVRRPASWSPMPTRYDVQMLADTTLIKSGSPVSGETYTVNWSGRPRAHRAKVTVTLPDGQVQSAETSLAGGYYGACYQ